MRTQGVALGWDGGAPLALSTVTVYIAGMKAEFAVVVAQPST